MPVRFAGETSWTLAGPTGSGFDGLPTTVDTGSPAAAGESAGTAEAEAGSAGAETGAAVGPSRTAHLAIDHVVVFTPELERTIAAFESNGVRCRRIREVGPPDQQLRQAFFRFGEVIAEVVQVPAEQVGPDGTARFWGLTITVADLDRAVADLGERVGTVRDAVQPGRRIATLRKEAGLGLAVALITPQPPRE